MALIGRPLQLFLMVVAVSDKEWPEIYHLVGALFLGTWDAVVAILLGLYGTYQLHLALRNRTSIVAREVEAVYDVGALANFRQVFGRQWWLWPLPLWLSDGPEGDGLSWPRRPPSPRPER